MKGLFPSPPKVIFAMTIETKLPMIIMYTGRLDGTLKASRIPVTRADPSVMETGFLKKNFCMRYSNRRQERTDVAVTIKAPYPK